MFLTVRQSGMSLLYPSPCGGIEPRPPPLLIDYTVMSHKILFISIFTIWISFYIFNSFFLCLCLQYNMYYSHYLCIFMHSLYYVFFIIYYLSLPLCYSLHVTLRFFSTRKTFHLHIREFQESSITHKHTHLFQYGNLKTVQFRLGCK